jgi:hypothetical protein
MFDLGGVERLRPFAPPGAFRLLQPVADACYISWLKNNDAIKLSTIKIFIFQTINLLNKWGPFYEHIEASWNPSHR